MTKYVQAEFNWTASPPAVVNRPEEARGGTDPIGHATLPGLPVDATSAAPTSRRRRNPAVLPVPKPLPSAIGRGHFGEDEHGPIRPDRAEVRTISEQHGQRLIDLLDGLDEVDRSLRDSQCSDRARLYREKDRLLSAFQSAIAMYVEDFGTEAAQRLEAWARHQRSK